MTPLVMYIETSLFSQTFSVCQPPFFLTILNAVTPLSSPDTITVWL